MSEELLISAFYILLPFVICGATYTGWVAGDYLGELFYDLTHRGE